jgi:hypothetical protein
MIYSATQFYAKDPMFGLPLFILDYRCHVNNKNKGRKTTKDMGKGLGYYLSLKEGDDKRDDTIRCDKFRGILVKKPNFQIG